MVAKAGGEHTLYEDKRGNLFSAGACGLGWCRLLPLTRSLFDWQKVTLPNGNEPVRLFHPSYYHNLAVGASTGKLYAWGCGTFVEGGNDGVIPALGPNAGEDRGGLPVEVPLPPSGDTTVRDICGGAYHSVVLTNAGAVLTFGANQLGQLGREISSTPHQADASGAPVDPHPAPAEGLPLSGEQQEIVQSVAAGFYNTFAICRSGKLYCAGENQNQQCGVRSRNLRKLTPVTEVSNVDQVSGGYCHTLVKTFAGKVFSLGCGDDGQRGKGFLPGEDDNEKKGELEVASEVELPVAAKQVAAGANHSVVLGEDGIAYTFGANDVGQCGVVVNKDGGDDGDDEEGTPVLCPTPLKLPTNAGRVIHVSAGYAHTVLNTDQGKTFVFGQNDSGQLGLGRSGSTSSDDLNDEEEEDVPPCLKPVEVNNPGGY